MEASDKLQALAALTLFGRTRLLTPSERDKNMSDMKSKYILNIL